MPLEYIRRLDNEEIEAYISAINANEHRKQLLFVPMDEKNANRIKAQIYNDLLTENPIFNEHEAMIEASRAQYLKGKKVGK